MKASSPWGGMLMSQVHLAEPTCSSTDTQESEAPTARILPTIHRRMLEAILPDEVSPSLREALRDVGFDPESTGLEPVSLDVFHAMVDVLGHALLPLGSQRERQRLTGRRMVKGFSEQPAGRVYYGGLRSVGPERTMSRLPSSLRFGASGMAIQVDPLGIRSWRVRLIGSSPGMSEFFCGTVLEMLAQTGVPEARAVAEPPTGSIINILVCWEDLGPKPFVDGE